MQSRLPLLMGASAMLYLGPLLAGVSGVGWAGLPVFMALFALWLVVMRPAQWPRDPSEWTGATALAAVAQLGVNAVIVIALFSIGRGIGGVAGVVPQIPAMFPVAVSFLAIPLSRWAVDPVKLDQMNTFLDAAIQQINDPAARPPTDGLHDDMVSALLDLPVDSDPVLIADAVDAAMTGPHGSDHLAGLEAALCHLATPNRALSEAVVLWATDPARDFAHLHRAQDVAFQVCGLDPLLLHLFAHRGAALLDRRPDTWGGIPNAEEVSMAADRSQPENLQAALHALSEVLTRAAKG